MTVRTTHHVAGDVRVTDEQTSLTAAAPPPRFLFSAPTYNAHRIHYDLPYATAVESLPGRPGGHASCHTGEVELA